VVAGQRLVLRATEKRPNLGKVRGGLRLAWGPVDSKLAALSDANYLFWYVWLIHSLNDLELFRLGCDSLTCNSCRIYYVATEAW
jgi:hypothetical protein